MTIFNRTAASLAATGSRREQIVALAARHGISSIYDGRDFTVGGGLRSYGASFPDGVRQAGITMGSEVDWAQLDPDAYGMLPHHRVGFAHHPKAQQ